MKACNWRALHRKLEEKKVKKLITKKHAFKKSAASITRQHFMKTIVNRKKISFLKRKKTLTLLKKRNLKIFS